MMRRERTPLSSHGRSKLSERMTALLNSSKVAIRPSKLGKQRRLQILTLTVVLCLTLQQLQYSSGTFRNIRRMLCLDDSESISAYVSVAQFAPSRPDDAGEDVSIQVQPIDIDRPQIPGRRNPPSHILMCKEFMNRRVEVQDKKVKIQDLDPFSVIEDPAVCVDWSAPHASMTEIIASTVIGKVGGKYKISYRHDCASTKKDNEKYTQDWTTIQQMFPKSSLVLDDGSVNEDEIARLCRGCLKGFEPYLYPDDKESKNPNPKWFNPKLARNCLLYPGTSRPLVNQKHETDLVALEKDKETAGHSVLHSILPTVKDRFRLAAAEHKLENDPDSELPSAAVEEEDGVVIYIEEASLTMTKKQYAKFVPASAKTISILIDPLCASSGPCLQHSTEIRNYMQRMYPNAKVIESIVTSTYAAFSRMILAKYLVCSPGTTSCLYAALAKEDNSFSVVAESTMRANTYHYFDLLSSYENNVQITNVDGYVGETRGNTDDSKQNKVVSGSRLFDDIDEVDFASTKSTTVAEGSESVNRDGCVEIRGRLGAWEHDFAYESLFEGNADRLRGSSKVGLLGLEDRHSTVQQIELKRAPGAPDGDKNKVSPTWQEEDPECALDMLNLAGLCEVVSLLKLSVIQFVGDDYTKDMVHSFWKLLQLPDADDLGEQPMKPGQSRPVYRKTVDCEAERTAFDAVFTPNENLVVDDYKPPTRADPIPRPAPTAVYSPTPRSVNVPAPAPGGNLWWNTPSIQTPNPPIVNPNPSQNLYNDQCACVPFANQYQTYVEPHVQTRQFIVAGLNPNQSYDAYCNNFNQFGQNLMTVAQPNDIVMMRSAVTPYGSCGGRRRAKEAMSDQDIQRANEYMHKAIDEFRRRNQQSDLKSHDPSQSNAPQFHMLDVSHMTRTHPHAVAASASKDHAHGRKLCQRQGVQVAPMVDSWNHALYTNMRDIAFAQPQPMYAQPQQVFMGPPRAL